jgi:hypothetical protein
MLRVVRVVRIAIPAAAWALTLCGTAAAAEGKLMIYPANGQSAERLGDDRYACHLKAVEQSGFDPTNPAAEISSAPITVEVPENPKQGAVAKGTAAGAAAGAVIGNNNHDTLGGAILGAVVGSAIGGAVEAKGGIEARQKAEAQAKQQAAARADRRAALERSRAEYRASIQACLEARGYVVR